MRFLTTNLSNIMIMAAMSGKKEVSIQLIEGEKHYHACKNVLNRPLQALYHDDNHWHNRKWAVCFIERMLGHIKTSCEEMDKK